MSQSPPKIAFPSHITPTLCDSYHHPWSANMDISTIASCHHATIDSSPPATTSSTPAGTPPATSASMEFDAAVKNALGKSRSLSSPADRECHDSRGPGATR